MKRIVGKVYLVGAGPGDPGLLTLRGAALIASADAIVMDALVNRRVVAGARGEVIDAGKRGPAADRQRGHGPTQQFINRLLVRLARAGKTVVRLKGGDPFVFGRGAEELEALRAARIPFEVVPGVSSATAVPAYAGIPITDRRWASQVTFVTGHEKEGKELAGVDWERLSPGGTLVVLMGVRAWPSLAARLLRHGWPARTPVAAIESGTTPSQRVLRAALADSGRAFSSAKLASPAVIVVGWVAAQAGKLSWLARERPLFGRSVAMTRTTEANESLKTLLETEGAEAVSCPLIDVRPYESPELARVKDDFAARRARYHGVVFLSASAVRALSELWPEAPRLFAGVRVAAVGPKTAEAAGKAGWRVTFVPETFSGAALAGALGGVVRRRLFLPRAKTAPADPVRRLAKAGAVVDVVPVYETRALRLSPAARARLLRGVDAVTFLSASAVAAFADDVGAAAARTIFKRAAAVCIGPSTAAAARARLAVRPIVAKSSTAAGVVDVLRRHFAPK